LRSCIFFIGLVPLRGREVSCRKTLATDEEVWTAASLQNSNWNLFL
jgi:hypothetical protein